MDPDKRFHHLGPSLLLLGLLVGLFAPTAQAGVVELIGVHRDTGELYAIPTDPTAPLRLLGGTGVSGLASLEFAPNGNLYGFSSGENPKLYLIDPIIPVSANEGAPLHPDATPGDESFVFEGGLAFDENGKAYGTNGIEQFDPILFTIDLNTGAATMVGTMLGQHDIDGLGWYDGGLIGLDRVSNAIVSIDPTTAAVSTLFVVSPTIGTFGGMVLASDGTGYFSTGGPDASGAPGSNELWSFDVESGDHSLIRDLSPIDGEGISGLAIVPEPMTLALLAVGSVALLRRRR